MKEELKQELIKEAINRLENPWKNLTVKDVSKDLNMYIKKILNVSKKDL